MSTLVTSTISTSRVPMYLGSPQPESAGSIKSYQCVKWAATYQVCPVTANPGRTTRWQASWPPPNTMAARYGGRPGSSPRLRIRCVGYWGYRSQAIPLASLPSAAPVNHSLLFAVGAWPPHDGVRRARCLNLSRDLWGLRPSVPDSQRGHLAHRPHGNDVGSAVSGGNWNSFHYAAAAVAACLPQRNSDLSTHMRCRMTASFRATATRARAMPQRLAMFMPQARKADHLVLRTSSEWAAS